MNPQQNTTTQLQPLSREELMQKLNLQPKQKIRRDKQTRILQYALAVASK